MAEKVDEIEFSHSFFVDAEPTEVAEFHFDPQNMSKLTPPVALVRYNSVPDRVRDDETVDFKMMMGPIPIRWVAEFSEVSELSFVDSQIEGPFEAWVHKHQFVPHEGGTNVIDTIRIRLKSSGRDRWVGKMMIGTLDGLFLYRKIQTKRYLG